MDISPLIKSPWPHLVWGMCHTILKLNVNFSIFKDLIYFVFVFLYTARRGISHKGRCFTGYLRNWSFPMEFEDSWKPKFSNLWHIIEIQ